MVSALNLKDKGLVLFAESIVDTIYEPLIVLNGDLRVVFANSAFYKFFMVNPSETEGKLIYDLGNKQWDIPSLRKLIDEILPKSSIITDFEVTHSFPDIGEQTLLLNARRLNIEKDNHMILISIFNITDRKKAEEDLKNSYKRLNIASRAAKAGIWDWDIINGKIDWSPMMFELFGIDQGTIPSLDVWGGILHPEDVKTANERIEKAIESHTFLNSEYRIIHSDGQIRWINALGKTEYDEDGRPLQMTGICIDITKNKKIEEEQKKLLEIEQQLTEELRISNEELKETEEELNETIDKLEVSNRELEQFAYVASHDLQEPLRMVSSFTQLLERKYKDKLDENADEYIEFIVDGAQRMKMLINDLLAFSRINTAPMEIKYTKLQKVLDDVLLDLKTNIDDNNATITTDSLPIIWCDPSQIRQLFQNLIANAIKFHDDELPRIHVSVQEYEDGWTFAVSDNGIGISPQHQEQIFDVFKRLHTREKYEGTGIGLAIGKKIVERHGGKIWVESKPEKGSTFYFTIPNLINLKSGF